MAFLCVGEAVTLREFLTSSALGDLSGVVGYTVRVRSPSWLFECLMVVSGTRLWGEVGGTREGEGEGEGEGVALSVASTWSCSVSDGVGVVVGVSCWEESKPESPDERFCNIHGKQALD